MFPSRRLFKGILNQKLDKPIAVPGILGDGYGNLFPGPEHYVYVRTVGGVEIIFNNRVVPENDVLVMVGYDPVQPDLYQVLSTRSATPGGTIGGGVTGYAPAIRYQWMAEGGGQDPLFVELRQFLPLRVGISSGMSIQIYRGTLWTGSSWIEVPVQTADLSPYLPTEEGKAALVLVTVDEMGMVILTKGSEVNITDLTWTDIPEKPDHTLLALAAVRVYTEQLEVQEARSNTDIVDLRTLNGGSSGVRILDEGTPLPVRPKLDFRGDGVVAYDDPTGDQTIIQVVRSRETDEISPITTLLTTHGYAAADTNGLAHRYDSIVSHEMGGFLYQAYGYWDQDGHLNMMIRREGEAWVNYDFDSITVTNSDDHRTISMGIDSNGYIHVSYDMHNENLKYRRSHMPIDSFDGNLTTPMGMLGSNESSVTYPTFLNGPDGVLHFMFRDGNATDGSLRMYTYNAAITTWVPAAGTGSGGLLIQGSSVLSQYWGYPGFSLSGVMHFAWIWADSSINQFKDLSYVSWDGSAWHQSDGSLQTVPITHSNCEIIDTPFEYFDLTDWYNLTQLNPVSVDSAGHPHIAYGRTGIHLGTTPDPYHHLSHVWHNGSEWIFQKLTNTLLDPSTQNIWPQLAIDKFTDQVYVFYRDPLDVENDHGLLLQVSNPGDYTQWTKYVIYPGDIGDYSTAAYSIPKFDHHQWDVARKFTFVVEIWHGSSSSLPIYTTEIFTSRFAAYDAANHPSLHTNDIDHGIHWTLAVLDQRYVKRSETRHWEPLLLDGELLTLDGDVIMLEVD